MDAASLLATAVTLAAHATLAILLWQRRVRVRRFDRDAAPGWFTAALLVLGFGAGLGLLGVAPGAGWIPFAVSAWLAASVAVVAFARPALATTWIAASLGAATVLALGA